MSARAVWRGVLKFDGVEVGVKLYSALENRSVSFRLLSREHREPVRQVLLDQESGEFLQYGDAGRGFVQGDKLVALSDDELASLEPEPSRVIEVKTFVAPELLDARWFERPYYLGPDSDEEAWHALAAALERTQKVGLARWVMRKKEYVGGLRSYRGYPMLVTMRNIEEVLGLDAVDLRDDTGVKERELAMAAQLIKMMEDRFEPGSYADEYRERVLDLVEQKKQGKTVKLPEPEEVAPVTDLAAALERSLEQEEARA